VPRKQKRVASLLTGAVISAAFLGPGTVTTAARAGAAHGLSLLWALAFSTAACWILQEASARMTLRSGLPLGKALRQRFEQGAGSTLVLIVVLGAVVLGCAAYEAGNILGGVAGAGLALGWSRASLTVLCGAGAGLLLWLGSLRLVSAVLAALVGVMGAAFMLTAMLLRPPVGELFSGLLRPQLPSGSGLLVLALIGTTVVPYNLFLGSGLARGQDLRATRWGLAVAIVLGGLISMAVVVVGTAVGDPFSYEALAEVLSERLGSWARGLFAMGLFAAGFSSAVTAPLAAAMTARSIFERPGGARWDQRSARYRGVWLAVLLSGVGFGLSGVRPVPAIVLAQALNGLLLPLVAVFLLLAINDRRMMGQAINGRWANLVTAVVVWITLVLGLRGLAGAAATSFGLQVGDSQLLLAGGIAALLLAWPVARALAVARRS